MSLSMMTKLQLMAYTDGELSDAETAEVEGLLSRNAEARQFVSAVSEPAIGQFVRANEAARQSPSVVDAVMARIQLETESDRATQPSNVLAFAPRKRADRVGFVAFAVTTITAVAASALVYMGASRYAATPSLPAVTATVGSGEVADDGLEVAVESPGAVFPLEPDPSGPGMAAATLVWFENDDDDDDETPGGDR